MSKHILIAFFVVSLIAPGAKAQKTSSMTDSTQLDEIVITASKIPLPLRETAKPVQMISKETIEQSFGKDLSQLLQEQAGIIINGAYSNPSTLKGVYVRGASSQYTLILLDGQPVLDPSSIGGVFDVRFFPIEQIERIDILKGSQSTLYGTDAIAGVINIITRKDAKKPIRLYGAASFGTLQTAEATLGLDGKKGKLDYNLSYQRNQTQGLSEAQDRDGAGDFDKDGLTQHAVQANLGLSPVAGLRISPYLRYTDYDADFDAEAFTDGDNTFESEVINPGLQAKFEKEKFSLYADYGFTQTDRFFKSAFFDNTFKGRFHNADVFGSYRLMPKLQVMGGLQFQHQQVTDNAGTVENPTINISSPYLTLLFRNLKGLNLELGARLNNHTLFGNQMTYSIAPAYKIWEGGRVFGSYTTGFKTPTLSELYGAFGANENLEPQRSATWEAGLQFDLFKEKLQVTLTYFQREIKDIIIYNFAIGYINQDRQEDYGLELDFSLKLDQKLRLRGNYSFIDGEVTTLNATEQDTSYYNLIRRPKHSFSLGLDYELHPRVFISVQGHYFGKRIDYFFNPENFYTAEEVDLDAYLLLNLYSEYRMADHRVVFFVDLKNILDTNYTEIYGYNTLGFNIQSGIRFRL
ncbi:MAG: TonB-dependent receptor [Microscillaceae bacterium]|nr:TonB-dependent receptor [Microscillaceae bacterium]